jgi:hypothetical protein
VDRARANESAAASIVAASRRYETVQLGALVGPGITAEADEICQEICGVRARRPWADVDLWEFFLSLPADQKYPDMRSKTLVRSLVRGTVPDEVLDRRTKTVFDDAVLASVDYPTLRKLLVSPAYRMRGVGYELLEERLSREDLSVSELKWTRNLASVHAFLSLWD